MIVLQMLRQGADPDGLVDEYGDAVADRKERIQIVCD